MNEINLDETNYLKVLEDILENGDLRKTRNSNTKSKFSVKLDFDISNNFPLLTTKKMFYKGIFHELLWFISGNTNSKDLEKNNVNIWKKNSSKSFLIKSNLNNYEEGDCGPIYGFQWRHFNADYKGFNKKYDENDGIDQLQNCIDLINNDPFSRRIFMSAWNPCQLKEMCLPPCHVSYQFYITNNNQLCCNLYQRSGDMFLGIPFNIASVSLLVYIISNLTNKKPGKISIIIGDAHIYEEHFEAVRTQIKRTPKKFPNLIIKNQYSNINDYNFDDFEINNYDFHPQIKAEMIE